MFGKDMAFSAPSIFHLYGCSYCPTLFASADTASVWRWTCCPGQTLTSPVMAQSASFFLFQRTARRTESSPFPQSRLSPHALASVQPEERVRYMPGSSIPLYFLFSKRLKLSGKVVSPQKLNGEFGFDMFIYCTGIIQCSGLKEI